LTSVPIYVYETVPQVAGEAAERFELRQPMSDAPLTQHPESGAPVRRVLSGGLVTFTQGTGGGEAACGMPMPKGMGGCGAGSCCMN
jgi:predicted nucleic acid-binding Zn ribbon protein